MGAGGLTDAAVGAFREEVGHHPRVPPVARAVQGSLAVVVHGVDVRAARVVDAVALDQQGRDLEVVPGGGAVQRGAVVLWEAPQLHVRPAAHQR